ncbi:hypothetical protein EX30DRAFT_374426 [Ascodesmis nigricans]|uniref:Integrase zinc-binding domain-containing protein n=1 Tax=Ascodesmis nigricans TaxID=341454 RepID=A0A4S2MLG7_9PEZI|nr:hypothetical protein EX30DRAFT_374426 [Ascodesmis nigricans]
MDQHHQQQHTSPHGLLNPMYPPTTTAGYSTQQPAYATHTQLPPVRPSLPGMQLPITEENSYNTGYVPHPPAPQTTYFSRPLPPIERHNEQMMTQSYFGAQTVTLPIRGGPPVDYSLSRQPRHPMFDQETDTRPGRYTLRCPERLYAPNENASQLPTEVDFYDILNDYIISLSPKKRDKALIPLARYDNIMRVLQDPKCTTIESAQFRFWSKKMFSLTDYRNKLVVTHEGKPVAVKEDLYIVLTNAHLQAQHGGRDKTSTQVRKHFSWVPKELIARFVKACPQCKLRRSNPSSSSRQMRRKSTSPYSRSKSPPSERPMDRPSERKPQAHGHYEERNTQAPGNYDAQFLQRSEYIEKPYNRQGPYNTYSCSQPPTPMGFEEQGPEPPSPPYARSSEPITPEAFPNQHVHVEYRGGSTEVFIPYHHSGQVQVSNVYTEPVSYQHYTNSPFPGIKQERIM